MNNIKVKKFHRFREEYPSFFYNSYEYSETELSFDIVYHFDIPGLAEFHPTWSITKSEPHAICVNNKQLDELVFSLGMVELISYWKLTCSPNVYIKNRVLTDEQVIWWKKLYFKGLGEFFYTNGIPIGDDFLYINHFSNVILSKSIEQEKSSIPNPAIDLMKVLVPVGGGKDSAVTLELLKNAVDRYCYIINPRQATLDTVNVSGLCNKTLIATRKLDSSILELNSKGFLNGHTPFSAIVAFSSVLAAYINNINYVALSNESSANEATVENTDINHQYSKSFEFEQDFRNYESKYINTNVQYFSLLRPLTELQIAKLFASFKNYHSIFRSCNVGSKTDVWCGECPKCLFVYIILSPFLDDNELIKIFGKDMLNNECLLDTFEKLIGLQPEKPFECVGSRNEIKAALQMAIKKYIAEGKPIPLLLKYYKEKFDGTPSDVSGLLDYFDETNFIPTSFLSLVKQKINV